LAWHYGWLHTVQHAAVVKQPGLYTINHFVDGDTIAVNMNGVKETVRFIGVDTPETHKPNTPVQCYGPAAAAYTKATIGNGSVRLASDPLNTDRDRYGRLLRYVYLQDGRLLNKLLIQNGYGFYYPYFPFSKKEEFAAVEKTAMAAHKGLWGNCSPTPTDSGGYVSNTAT
jgi:micrococcal nuclease